MSILVIAEHDNDSIKAATLNTVTAAQALGDDVHVLVAGASCQGAAAAAAEISGIAKVICASAAREYCTACGGACQQLQSYFVCGHHHGEKFIA